MKQCIRNKKVKGSWWLGIFIASIYLCANSNSLPMQLGDLCLLQYHNNSTSQLSIWPNAHIKHVAIADTYDVPYVSLHQRIKKSSCKIHVKYLEPKDILSSFIHRFTISCKYFFTSSYYFNYLYLLYCILLI